MSGFKLSGVAVKLTFCLLAIASLSNAELPKLCGKQKTAGGLVFSGDPSRPGQFPWAGVMLWKDTMKPFCGCSLISNEFAITAAHCFYEKKVEKPTRMSSVHVQFGRNDLSDEDEIGFVTRSLIDLTLHEDWDPKYDEHYDADIAIIRFNQSVRFSSLIQPICLPIADRDIHKNGSIVSIRNALSFAVVVCNFFCRSAGEFSMKLEKLLISNFLLKLTLLITKNVRRFIPKLLRTLLRIELTAVASRATESILVKVIAASTLGSFIYYATY